MNNDRALWWSFAIAFMSQTALGAPAPPTIANVHEVRITISPSCRVNLATSDPRLTVVLDGDEQKAFTARYVEAEDVWVGEKTEWSQWMGRTDGDPFPADGRKASLRFKGGRTECRNSGEPKRVANAWMATFSFYCNEEKVHDVVIVISPSTIPISYVREVPNRYQGVACTEMALYTGPIRNVWDSEHVSIKIGSDNPKDKDTGVPLDEGILEKYRKTGLLRVGKTDVPTIREKARGVGRNAAATTSGIAIDIDQKKLENSNFNYFEVKKKVTP